MAKGTIAKQEVIKKIQSAFGTDFLGEFDKKIYVQVQENGEMVQIAMALTCPKTPVAVSNAPIIKGDRMDFSDESTIIPVNSSNTEISEEERQTIADMMARFGL